MAYRGGYAVLLVLHLISVVFVIGPLALGAMRAPRLLRGGPAALPELRSLLRATRLYGLSTVVVVAFGLSMIRNGAIGRQWSFSDTWVSVSLALWLIATLLTVVVVGGDVQRGIAMIEGGAEGSSFAGRAAAAGGIATLMWLAIIALMVTKPGA